MRRAWSGSKAVWHSDGIPDKKNSKKVDFEKNRRRQKHEKLPSMQRVNWFLFFNNVIFEIGILVENWFVTPNRLVYQINISVALYQTGSDSKAIQKPDMDTQCFQPVNLV